MKKLFKITTAAEETAYVVCDTLEEAVAAGSPYGVTVEWLRGPVAVKHGDEAASLPKPQAYPVK